MTLLAPDDAVSATLKGWYDASTEAAADGTSIGTAVDQSTYGKNLTEATNKPTIETAGDGRRYWLFNGSTHKLTGAAAADWKFLNDGTHTYFVVCELVAHSADGRSTVLDTGGLSVNNIGVWLAFDNRGGAGNGGPNGLQARATRNASPNDIYQLLTGDPTIAVGLRTIIAVRAQSGTAEIRIWNARGQRIADSSVTFGGTNPLGALRLAMRTSGTALPANLKLHEAFFFDGDLSDSEFDGVHEYLDDKWAVETWTADSANPISVENTSTYDAFPSIAQASNGDLLAVARRGTSHTSLLGDIVQWRSTDDGASWSAEGVIFDGATENLDLRDTGLTRMMSGDMMLACSVRDAGGSSGPDGCRWALSSDDGATWGPLQTLNDAFAGFSRASTRPCLMPNGDLLWPIYGNTSGAGSSTRWLKVYLSTDDAVSWSYLADIGASGDATGWGETSIVRTPGGDLVALIRNDVQDALYRSVSTDDGATWTAPAATTPVTSNVDAVLANASSSPQAAYTARGLLVAAQRDTSNIGWLVTSTDDGATWQRGSRLSTGAFEYGSPVVLGGLIVLLFSRESSSSDADLFVDRYTEFYDPVTMPLRVTLRSTESPLDPLPIGITLRGPVTALDPLPIGITLRSPIPTLPPMPVGVVLRSPVTIGTVALGPVPHEARQGGLRITEPGDNQSTFAIELIDPAHPDHVLAHFVNSFDRSFTDTFDGEGRVQLSLLNGDADLAAVVDGLLLRVRYKGRYAMLATVGPRSKVTLAAVSPNPDTAEEADEITVITGDEALAALRKALVYPGRWLSAGPNPKPKEDSRQFNAGTAPFDDSGWDYATQLERQGDPSPIGAFGWQAQPPAFPDPDAQWIAGPGCTITFAPGSAVAYIRRTFVLGVIGGSDVTSTRLYFGADDFLTIFVDGQQLTETLEVNSRTTLRYVDIDLTDGEHTLFFVLGNIAAWTPFNPMGLVYTLQEMNGDTPIGVLFDSTTLAPIRSSGGDRILFNPPEPPGITAGQILLTLIFEMFARGIQTWWTWDFTVAVDSAGNAWPTVPNFVVTDGTDYREAMRALITARLVDIKVDPYRPLIHAYVGGTFGDDSGASFPAPVEGVDHSLSELHHGTDEPRANVLLVTFATGRIEVVAPGVDFDVTERIEASLDLGKVRDEATARAEALAVLVTSSTPYHSVAAGWEPEDHDHDPYLNPLLIPGNYVDVATEGLDDVERVQLSAVTISEDADGVAIVSPELADLATLTDQLTHAWLERSAPGQMGGVYPIGSVPAPVSLDDTAARTPGFAFSLGEVEGTIRNMGVHVRVHPREILVERWDAANVPSTTGTSVVRLYVNAAVVVDVTLSPGDSGVLVSIAGLADPLTPSVDTLACELVTSSGADHTAVVRTEHLQ